MGIYDQAARYAAKLDPPGFLSWLLADLDPAYRFARWLDTQTLPWPGQADRRCDTVAELTHVAGLGSPWAVVVELQTEPDPDLPERGLEYLARLRREMRHGPYLQDKYPVAAAVVQLTGVASTELEMVLPGQTEIALHWHMGDADLQEFEAEAVLAGIAGGEVASCLLP